MDPYPPQSIILIIVTLLLHFALAATDEVSEARLSRLSDDGNKKAEKALKLMDKNLRVSNSIRMLKVLFEMLSAYSLTVLFQNLFNISPSSVFLPLVIILFALIIQFLGVIIFRMAASKGSEKIFFALLWLITLSYYVCLPFERIMSYIASVILKPLGVRADDNDDDDVTEEEIRFMVDVGSESGAIEQEEKEMIHNIFELNDTPVKDVMTHRTEVAFLWMEESTEEWEETIAKTNHSVYPVCGETVDDVVGILKTADFYKLLRSSDEGKEISRDSILKNPYLVPESIKADDLFRQMQKNRNHFSVVLDEYGGLAGIITMSDLLEEIVGDLDNDSEAPDEEEIVRLDDNTWKIAGSAEIEGVSQALEAELPVEDYNTFAGLILAELGAVPDDGTTARIEAYGLNIKVTRVSEHRIDETIVSKIIPKSEQ